MTLTNKVNVPINEKNAADPKLLSNVIPIFRKNKAAIIT
jgi:hypothetical protein